MQIKRNKIVNNLVFRRYPLDKDGKNAIIIKKRSFLGYLKGDITMGLIKAGFGALGGTLADQWKEYFYCDALPIDVLCTKGQKRTTAGTSNTKASDNVISNGSGISVADIFCFAFSSLKSV